MNLKTYIHFAKTAKVHSICNQLLQKELGFLSVSQ